MLLWCHTQLVVESVVPDLLHVIPIGHDAVLDGVLQGQDTKLALGLIAHVAVLLVHAHHDAWHLWPSNNGRKHSPWRIIASTACLAHAGAVVHNQSCHFLLGHG